MGRRGGIAAGVVMVLCCAASTRAAGAAVDPAQDLENQYQQVVSVLKKPPLSGVVVTEVPPESPAAAAGLRGGDIILEYYGTKITSLKVLSEQVALAIGQRLENNQAGKLVLMKVRRDGDERVIGLPRELLNIRAVEVEVGAAGPRNPPPNQRGALALDWKDVLATLRADGTPPDAIPGGATDLSRDAVPAAFRMMLHADAVIDTTQPSKLRLYADEEWAGWQICRVTGKGEDVLEGKVEMFHIMPFWKTEDDKVPTEHSTFTFRLRLGDYKTAPAFVLEAATSRTAAPAGQENMQYVIEGTRLGEKLQTNSGLSTVEGQLGDGGRRPEKHENGAPLSAAPQWALPWIAAALPQEDGDALGLYLLSTRDMLPRPGYVLATRGRVALPVDPLGADAAPATASGPVTTTSKAASEALPWRVDVMHTGVVVESYWFTDQRRLICVQTQGPQSIVTRRPDSVKAASSPQEKKTK